MSLLAPPQLNEDADLAMMLGRRSCFCGPACGPLDHLQGLQPAIGCCRFGVDLGRLSRRTMKVNRPYREANRPGWWIRWSDEHGERCKRSFDRHADAEHVISVEVARVGVDLGRLLRRTMKVNRPYREADRKSWWVRDRGTLIPCAAT